MPFVIDALSKTDLTVKVTYSNPFYINLTLDEINDLINNKTALPLKQYLRTNTIKVGSLFIIINKQAKSIIDETILTGIILDIKKKSIRYHINVLTRTYVDYDNDDNTIDLCDNAEFHINDNTLIIPIVYTA